MIVRERVVVTGMGAVGAFGSGVGALWRAVRAGEGLATRVGGGQPGLWWPACMAPVSLGVEDRPALRRQDRHVVLGSAAAIEAAADAGLDPGGRLGARTGVVWGTSRGPSGVWEEVWRDHESGRRPRPTLVPAGTLVAGAGGISVLLGAGGPVQCVSAACSSGAHAICDAARLILGGEADVVVAGASDSVLSPTILSQFEAAGLLAKHEDPALACRPFDRSRGGTVFGEGGGAVVLESVSHARGRGAPIAAVLAGWGVSADACSRIEPAPTGAGLERAIRQAMAVAGVDAAGIGYANLHGTGTIANDAAEAVAVWRATGGRPPPCGSTKAVTGHCVGATAAIEAIVAIMAMRHGIAPPSANLAEPGVDLPLIVGREVSIDARAVISTSAGFWGMNACLCFVPPEPC